MCHTLAQATASFFSGIKLLRDVKSQSEFSRFKSMLKALIDKINFQMNGSVHHT